MEEEELIQRAMEAFYRYQKKMGEMPIQPSKYSSHVDNDILDGIVVILENTNGVLARYKYNEETDRLKRLQLTPNNKIKFDE